MNDKMGPEGYVLTLLVYGMMPRLSHRDGHGMYAHQMEKMKALQAARTEMGNIAAKLRVNTAKSSYEPKTSLNTDVEVGGLVLKYRKNS